VTRIWHLALALLSVGCQTTDVKCFTSGGGGDECGYGGGQPGEHLAEGGEIRHERVRAFGVQESWIQLYQYNGPAMSMNAALPPEEEPEVGPFGYCIDERNPAAAGWPFKPIEGATYLDFPITTLTGTGIASSLAIPKTVPPNTIGNSTYRTYDFTYGGGQPGTATPGFNGTLTVDEAAAEGHYTLDIEQDHRYDYYLPPDYAPPLDIGGADTVVLSKARTLELSWAAPPNDHGADGRTKTQKPYYAYTVFVDPNAAFPPQFMCLTDKDGHQSIPKTVLAALPAEGIVMHVETTHYMDHLDAGGEDRRFDLVASLVNISPFAMQ
jgi:hypothetical protein